MTHPLDRPLGPVAQSEYHWSYHDGINMQYDLMCRLPMAKGDAECLIETLKLAVRAINISCGLDDESDGGKG